MENVMNIRLPLQLDSKCVFCKHFYLKKMKLDNGQKCKYTALQKAKNGFRRPFGTEM